MHKWLVLGGVERVLINYLNLFTELNYDVDLIIKYDLNEGNIIECEIPKKVSYHFIFDKLHFDKLLLNKKRKKENILYKVNNEIFKLYDYTYYNKKITEQIKSKDYDIIIDFSECLDKFMRTKTGLNLPSKTVRWIHGQLNTNNLKKYQQIFKRYSRVITICNQMKNRIIEQLNYTHHNFSTIYNYIDHSKIRLLSLESSPYTSPLLKDKFLLQVSRLVDGKGHFELIDIYNELKKKGINHKLYLIGDGENRSLLNKKIHDLGLENDCILLGEVSNPYPFFKNADLFIHTSESEGLPTVLLESMALGVPVVAMDCPTGPREIIGDNDEYGKLIPMHNKTAFVDAVYELLNNVELYQHYVKQSLTRIQDFSSEKIGKEVDSLFKEIIAENKKNQ